MLALTAPQLHAHTRSFSRSFTDISPDYFWKTGVQIVLALSHSITLPLTLLPVFTEYIYALLSLSSKMFLGLLLYFNVLMFSSFSEALSDTVANNASPPPPPVARM